MARAIAAACLLLVAIATLPTADADVCRKEKGCTFWDSNYHEYILYEVDTSSIEPT